MKSIDLRPDISESDAISLLKEHSLLVLRQVLDPVRVKAFAAEVEAAFAELDADRARLSDESRRLLDRMEMPVPQKDTGFLLRLKNYRVLDSARLRSILEGASGPFFWHYPPMIRRQNPVHASAALPYHQDSSYTRHYARFITCWTPLTPCGSDAPGLECIPGSAEALDHKPNGPWEHGLDATMLDRLKKDRGTIMPILFPGDVVLFGQDTLHRTHITPGMNRARFSIDFRAAPVAAIDPELRAKRRFVHPKEMAHV